MAWALATVVGLPAGVLALGLVSPEGLSRLPRLCLWSRLLGSPCPGCGTTRALCSLIHGDLAGAWGYNRNAVIVAPLLVWVWLGHVRAVWRLRRTGL